MTKETYIQDNLPNFEKICTEARQTGLDKKVTLSRQYIRFAKMEQKCHDPKALAIIQRQKERLAQSLATPTKEQEEAEISFFRKRIRYLIEHNISTMIET